MFIRDQKGRPQNIVSRFENLPLWLSIFIQLTIFCRAMFFFLFPSVSNFLDRLRSNKCQTWQTDETSSLLLQQVKRLTTWVQLQGSVFKANSIFSRVCGPTKLPIRMPNFRFPKSTNFDSSRIGNLRIRRMGPNFFPSSTANDVRVVGRKEVIILNRVFNSWVGLQLQTRFPTVSVKTHKQRTTNLFPVQSSKKL